MTWSEYIEGTLEGFGGAESIHVRWSEMKVLQQVVAKAGVVPFESQCIPADEALLAVDQYKTFLTERRARIAARLNEFLGQTERR